MGLVDITPIMTSNTTPSPYVVSASSIWSTQYDVYKAFDGSNTATDDRWGTVSGTNTGWVKIDFGSAKKIDAFSIICGNIASNNVATMPKSFSLYGSNDDISYEKIIEFSNEIFWSSLEARLYKLLQSVTFRYYKIVISANNGESSNTSIGDIKFWQDDGSTTAITNVEASMDYCLPKNSTLAMNQRQNDNREGLLGFANDGNNYGTLWMINHIGKAQIIKAAMSQGDILYEGYASSGALLKSPSNYQYLLITVAMDSNGGCAQTFLIRTTNLPSNILYSAYATSSFYAYSLFLFGVNGSFSLTDTQRVVGWSHPANVSRVIGIY
jgi:hypothetical protein